MFKLLTKYSILRWWVDFVFILILILITTIAWRGVLDQTIEGEGFYYFSPTNSFQPANWQVVDFLTGFDNFPRIATYILEKFFQGEMQLYMRVLFATIVLVNIAFYLFVRTATRKSWIALLAAAYMGINYSSAFQFYARGHYQWFLQRVPEFLPLIFSFGLLIGYINSRKLGYYFLSLLFFLVALIMTHYTTLLLPFIFSFMLASAFLKGENVNEKLKIAALSLPFVFLNYLIVKNTSLGSAVIRPNQTFLEFLTQTPDIINKISFQLVVATIPFSLLQNIINTLELNYSTLIPQLMLPVYLFYLLVIWFLYKKRVSYLNLIIGCFGGLLGVFFLTVYLNRVNVYNDILQGRYYFIPSMYVGIIFASLLYNIFKEGANSRFQKIIGAGVLISILVVWAILNTKLIWKQIKSTQHFYTASQTMFRHLQETKNNLPNGSAVFLPNPPLPGGENFLKKYYSNGNIQFLYLDTKWFNKIPKNFDISRLFAYEYTNEMQKGGNANLDKINIIDNSEKYRILFRQIQQKKLYSK